MFKKFLLSGICAATLAGCNDSTTSDTTIATKKEPFQLTTGSFTLNKPLADVSFTKDSQASVTLPLTVGFGSSAYHAQGDANNIFYTLTDRGPNIKCKDAKDILNIDNFCPESGDKIFPLPAFTPTIYKIQITRDTNNKLSYEIIDEIPLKDSEGKNITGLTNKLTATDSEVSIDTQGNLIEFDNSGLDTEALVKLQDGSFWLSDEYGPSLVHVASDGTVLKRLVPSSVATDLSNAAYPVEGALPDILKMRKLNRGIESIALSADEKSLYFAMQSPLANPDVSAYEASRYVRIFKLSLDNGDVNAITGEYIYRLDAPQTFADTQGNGDVGKKQKDIKISEMVSVGDDELVVLERATNTTKFYRINLKTADNIYNTNIASNNIDNAESEVAKPLELIYNLTAANATPVAKVLAFNTLTDMPDDIAAPKKIEGIALLDDKHVLLINDNDFGIEGDATTAIVLDVADKFIGNDMASQKASLKLIARHESGVYDKSAAEIVAFHKHSKRIFVVNAQAKQVDVLSGLSELTPLTNPLLDTNLHTDFSIDTSVDYSQSGGVNSVAIFNDLLAIAVEDKIKQNNGIVAFYQLDTNTGAATHIKNVKVGALPDNVMFTPDGKQLLAACEGEPSGDYTNDPEGSIAIISITDDLPSSSASLVEFTDFNIGGSRHGELPENLRIFGGAFGQQRSTVAQDLEPEYIGFSADSSTAFVSLQENNALAIIDITNKRVNKIVSLGFKDYSNATNALDISDKDSDVDSTGTVLHNGKARINIRPWQSVKGIYQPDTIATYTHNDSTYVVTANEGDAREYLSGSLNEDFTTEAECISANEHWDSSIKACYHGDTPTMCAEKGLLNKDNEECFSYVEEFRVEDLSTSGSFSDFVAPIPAQINQLVDNFSADISSSITDEGYGRLKISIVDAINPATSTIDTLQSYGARSFSIWNADGELVFDSGSDIAKITAGKVGEFFNASNDRAADSKKNDRSSAKGAEPEALAIGSVNGRTYAFIGLERVGGIMVYDITNPYGVQFVEYTLNRDFTKDPTDDNEGSLAGDIGPEGMKFIDAEYSPTGKALLIVGNEVSGTTSVYQVEAILP